MYEPTVIGDRFPDMCSCMECQMLDWWKRAPAWHDDFCYCYHCWTGEDEAEYQDYVRNGGTKERKEPD